MAAIKADGPRSQARTYKALLVGIVMNIASVFLQVGLGKRCQNEILVEVACLGIRGIQFQESIFV